MRDTHTGDRHGVAKEGRGVRQMVEEANAGPENHGREVDCELVEEAGVEELLDGIGTVNPDRFPGSGCFGLAHRALDPVRHEMDGRIGPRPAVGNLVAEREGRAPSMPPAPTPGDLERAPAGEHRPELGGQSPDVFCAWGRHPERQGIAPTSVDLLLA